MRELLLVPVGCGNKLIDHGPGVHVGGTTTANGTYTGGNLTHTGSLPNGSRGTKLIGFLLYDLFLFCVFVSSIIRPVVLRRRFLFQSHQCVPVLC